MSGQSARVGIYMCGQLQLAATPQLFTLPTIAHASYPLVAAMSAYKSLADTNGIQSSDEETASAQQTNKQRVLMLSSRGVTYRQAFRILFVRKE